MQPPPGSAPTQSAAHPPALPAPTGLAASTASADSPSIKTTLDGLLARRLHQRSEQNQLRFRRPVRIVDATHLEIDGKRCINFAANNYLALTHHPRLLSITPSTAAAGSGAAGLISGYTPDHASAEAALAHWKSTQAAVLLPSGYQANLAAIQTFAALADNDPHRVRFLIDKLAHASLIDALRATGLPFRVFPHNNMAKLTRLLHDADRSQLQVVVTESIFSMDGGAADLAAIARLKKEYDFALLLDEAHASGVYGDGGAGLTHEAGLAGLADVLICTLSKAAGSIGGAVCASQRFCDALVNFGRAYIFSTAVPPCTAQSAQTAIQIMREETWRQKRVRALALKLRAELKSLEVTIPTGDSPIVPIILGNEHEVTQAAAEFLSAEIFVSAIRPPSVPPGTSRLRFTLSCDHTDAEMDHLLASIKRIIKPATIKLADVPGDA